MASGGKSSAANSRSILIIALCAGFCGRDARATDPSYATADFGLCQTAPTFVKPDASAALPVTPSGGLPRGVVTGCDDGTVIDMLVVYTSAARVAAGGTAAIQARINAAVADTNAAFVNSLIDTSVNLVHAQEIVYAETGNSETDGLRLLDPDDGFLDDVHLIRDQHAADIAVLWVNALDTGGRVLARTDVLGEGGFHEMRQAEGTLTMAHELGHNLGCVHDRPNASPFEFFPYSFGRHEPGGAFHTIMAVIPPNTPLIPHFSNPDVLFGGLPTGVPIGQPNESHVAATIQQTRHLVANYRNAPMAGLPAVLHVDAAAAPGGDGATWGTAIKDLQDAICLARRSGGDVSEIWVRAGSYRPDRGTNLRLMTFVLRNDLGIYGGFAGGETMRSQRNPAANPTILSGDIGTPNNLTDNSTHVVFAKNVDASAVLDGFTIIGGNADVASVYDVDVGGGIRIESASPTIANCTITNNIATGNGGGIYMSAGSPAISGCAIAGNAGQNGAGIGVYNGAASNISMCSFSTNVAAFSGGALHNNGTSPTVSDCTFNGNAASFGGAIENFNNAAQFVGCDFGANNFAATAGGAVHNNGSAATFHDCSFVQNNSPYGGAMRNLNAGPTVTACLFDSNTADTGGAVGNDGAATAPVFEGCDFIGNSADWSGAMDNFGCSPSLAGCTFAMNEAANGGGAAIFGGAAGSPSVVSCEFVENSAGFGGAVYSFDSETLLIEGCAFTSNSANDGGAIYLFNAAPRIRRGTFAENTAGDLAMGFGTGGAIASVANSAPIISRSTFVANVAGYAAGAIRNHDGEATIVNCLFFGNTCDWSGGAVENVATDAAITGCVFTGNSSISSHGGAISNIEGSNAVMTNVTIANNSAFSTGGGIAVDAPAPVLRNSIVWGNTAGFGTIEQQQLLHFSGATIVTRSTVQGWTGALGGVGNNGTNPLFADANGPDNIIGTIDDEVRLTAGSAAIDSADNTLVPADAADVDGDTNIAERLPRDASNGTRFVNDVVANTGVADPPNYPDIVDRGAYEFGAVALCDTCDGDTNGDGAIDGEDVQSFVGCLLSGPAVGAPCVCADMNDSGSITIADIASFVSIALTGAPCN